MYASSDMHPIVAATATTIRTAKSPNTTSTASTSSVPCPLTVFGVVGKPGYATEQPMINTISAHSPIGMRAPTPNVMIRM